MNKLISLACLAMLGAAPLSLHAAAEPDDKEALKKKAPVPETLQQVTVSGTRANDTENRRNATAAKMIFGREELDRNGDSSVGEILKRLPGVTMGGPPGRGGRGGGQARMRGLGNGYTQMLVNGERPPAGFSLESLAPDQVERIEVIRGAVAEHSTQAIAGTINIVLREGYQQKDIQLRVSDAIEQGRHSPNVSLTMPGKAGKLTWLMTASLSSNREHDASLSDYETVNPAGALVKDETVAAQSTRSGRGIHLMPRASYKFDNGDTINFQPFLVHNRSDGTSESRLTENLRVDPPVTPDYALALGRSESSATFVRGFGNWLHRMEEGARLDVKFGFGGGRSESESVRNETGGTRPNRFDDRDSSRNRGLSTGGKYTSPMGKGHLLAVGWDAEAQHRSQNATALVNGVARFAESGENLTADTRRLAAFAQDEWDITPKWSVYLGLRWEGITTDADSYGRKISNTTSVWSPVLHSVWRLPGSDKDQIRASVTQSYRAPQLNDLIAAPTFSLSNDRLRPDRIGNPDLKPELSQGIDLAYEHYVGKSGILSVSGFARKIDDLMRRELSERMVGNEMRWLSTPSNIGTARTAGVELEAKLQLADLMADAPNLDLRANYSRFWSSVDGIPGPDNRLDQQAKQTANLGVDYRMKRLPLTLGGSYNWTPAILVQTSVDERVSTGVKRQFDVYGLWKLSANNQLRIGANNLMGDDYLSGRTVTTIDRTAMANTATRTYTTWSIRWEMKL